MLLKISDCYRNRLKKNLRFYQKIISIISILPLERNSIRFILFKKLYKIFAFSILFI